MGVKVRERKPGEWWIFIDHKGQRKAVKVGSESAAKKAAAKMEEGFAKGAVLPVPRTKVLFKDQFKKWIGQHVGMSCEVSTVETYGDTWRNHVQEHFGNLPLDAIDREKIREFYRVKKEEGYARATIHNMRNVISGVIELAIEDKLLEVNPTLKSGKYLRDAQGKRDAEFLTKEEGKLLLDAAKKYPVFYPFFLTALRTGLRQGELIGLRWDDIDWSGRFLTVRRTIYRKEAKIPKSGKTRRVDMSDQLMSILRDHKRAATAAALKAGKSLPAYVFTTRNQTPFEPSWIRDVFGKCLKASGLRAVPFHALRHSFASALIGNGAPLAYVMAQMGHSSIRITVDTYGHLVPGANREEVNKLDDAGYRSESATPAQPAAVGFRNISINKGHFETLQSCAVDNGDGND
jgi:integrase